MKAIAKYLPVIESIKEDDALYNVETGSIAIFGDKETKTGVWQKAKLFAVTKDIEVGDEVIALDVWKNQFEELLEAGKKGRCVNKGAGMVEIEFKDYRSAIADDDEHFGKVLGELSPNATWVKDGDEIEVESDMGFPVFRDFKGDGECGANRKWKQGEYIKVKCPTCKSFH